jgi:hypothetical protein
MRNLFSLLKMAMIIFEDEIPNIVEDSICESNRYLENEILV